MCKFSWIKSWEVPDRCCSHCLLPVRWKRPRKRRKYKHSWRRRPMKAASLTSSRSTQRELPSPTWAHPWPEGPRPSPLALLNPSYCCSCFYLPASAGGRAEDTEKTHTHRNAHTCTHWTCQQSWTDCCKIIRNVVKIRTSPFVSSIPTWFSHSCLCFPTSLFNWKWHFVKHLSAAAVVRLCHQ